MYHSIEMRPPDGTVPVVVAGAEEDREVVRVELVFMRTEIDAVIAAFDASVAASPSAADCRAIARPIVEAIVASRGS